MDNDALALAQSDLLDARLGPFFYCPPNYLVDAGSEYVPIRVGSLKHRLRKLFPAHEVNDAMTTIEDCRFVSYAGPLAGKDRGLHESADGRKLLATTSPTVISASPGAFPTIELFLEQLLVSGGVDQRPYFCGWLNCARAAMLERKPTPGHLLGLAGPRGSGKTQLIGLIELAMGGRRANPRDYFCGGRFNADLLAAELLVLDDEDVPAKEAARQAFKQRVKNFLYSGAPRIEAKHKDAFTFRGVWRAVVACNSAEDDLRALPAVDDGSRDKLLYLMCAHAFPEVLSDDEFQEWQRIVRAELPALLHFIETYEIPHHLRASRGRIVAWQHPLLLEKIHSLDGWLAMMELADIAAMAGVLPLPWKGKARELETILTGHYETERHAKKLFGTWHAKAGVLLSEAATHSERVYVAGKSGKIKTYRIEPDEGGACES